jgi:hypothetical protein
MGLKKVFVRLVDGEKYQILDRSDAPGIYSRQSQINITGPAEPQLPDRLLSPAEYLRWKAHLTENGYSVLDVFGI